MTGKFLESESLDSKIFAGRVLSLLGDVLAEVRRTQSFLEERFHVPSEYPREESYGDDEELDN